MGVIMKRGINYTGSEGIELTQAEYDALSTEEKNNGTTYFVTDSAHGGGGGVGGVAGLPDGGTTGQALVKKSNTDGDVEWKTIEELGSGWGVAKQGVVTVNAPMSGSSIGMTQVGISDLGLSNIDNYRVFLELNENSSADSYKIERMWVYKNLNSFDVRVYAADDTLQSIKVSYVVIAKGFGGSGSGSGIPVGGLEGQALLKNSDDDLDAGWRYIQQVPNGGAVDQIIAKNSETNGDVKWVLDNGKRLMTEDYVVGQKDVIVPGAFYPGYTTPAYTDYESAGEGMVSSENSPSNNMLPNHYIEYYASYQPIKVRVPTIGIIDQVGGSWEDVTDSMPTQMYKDAILPHKTAIGEGGSTIVISRLGTPIRWYRLYKGPNQTGGLVLPNDVYMTYTNIVEYYDPINSNGAAVPIDNKIYLSVAKVKSNNTIDQFYGFQVERMVQVDHPEVVVPDRKDPDTVQTQDILAHHVTKVVLDDLKLIDRGGLNKWGMAKYGTVAITGMTSSSYRGTSVDLSDLTIDSVNDYVILTQQSSEDSVNYGIDTTWCRKVSTTEAVVYAYSTSKESCYVDYVVLAKGYGNSISMNDAVLESPNGTQYRLKVADDGTLSTEVV